MGMHDCVIYCAIVTCALLGIKNFVLPLILGVVLEIVHLTNGVCIVFVPAMQM